MATLLIVLACALAPLSVVAVWARNQVTDTDRYVQTVARLASSPDIQNAIADQITAQIFIHIDIRGLTVKPSTRWPAEVCLRRCKSADIVRVRSGFNLLTTLGNWLPVIVLMLLAVGVYVGRDHRRALVGAGLGLGLCKKALRIGAVALASLALVFRSQPTGRVVISLAVLLLVALGLIELLGRPPVRVQPTRAVGPVATGGRRGREGFPGPARPRAAATMGQLTAYSAR